MISEGQESSWRTSRINIAHKMDIMKNTRKKFVRFLNNWKSLILELAVTGGPYTGTHIFEPVFLTLKIF